MNRREFMRLGLLVVAGSIISTTCRGDEGGTDSGSTKRRVIVIGAGLAGLAAAQNLTQHGHEVLVLEARDRIGGRTWTSTRWTDTPLDVGASWIHGLDGNPLTDLARTLNAQLLTTRYDSAVVYGPAGTPLGRNEQENLARLQGRIKSILRRAQDRDQDQSIQETIEKDPFWKELSLEDKQYAQFILNGTIEHEYAGSTSQLSTHWYDDAHAYKGEDGLLIHGYRVIVDHLAKSLNIALGQVVEQVDWSAREIVVKTNRGTHRSEIVVVTLPLGALKSGQTRFVPRLPETKTRAIQALGMGVLNKCYLRFPKSFWPDKVDWIEQVSPTRGEWTEWVSFVPSLKKPILLGFNAAEKGLEMEAWTDEQILANAMMNLRRLFGRSIPAPLDYQITRWHSDPFARGSYSFNALGSTPKMRDQLAEGVDAKLFFAGEATERKHFGTTHGAYLSGLRVANKVNSSA